MTIKELENIIKENRESYWSGNTKITDFEYDSYIEQLRKLDPNNHLLLTPEHGIISKEKQIKHKKPMLSLEKVYNKEDLMKWIKNVSRNDDELFYVQPKYDGISCHYDNGIYSTRGDGYIGENITDICKLICVSEYSNNTNKNDFLGEIVIKKSHFNTIFKSIKKPDGNTFKNSRNAIAGILGIDDYNYYVKQNAVLTLIDYNKYSFNMTKKEADEKWEAIKFFINSLDYPMDGIVIKIADEDYYKSLGNTSHHPKGAMAFKFENIKSESILRDVEFGMGKENITATAIFDPININGVTISRAVIPMNSKTLPCIMNGDFTKGSKLIVERAGDVIPHIINVTTKENSDKFIINKCPFCGGELIITDSSVKCGNELCRKKQVHRLYESLCVLGIKNIGESIVDKVCLNYLEKIFSCKLIIGNWMRFINDPIAYSIIRLIPGFGDTSANNIINETKMISKTTLDKFIASLGIPNVGMKIATILSNKYKIINNFINLKKEDISGLEGIGDLMAERIYNYIQHNKNLIVYSSEYFVFQEFDKFDGFVNHKKICFTGAMNLQRKDMFDIATKAGFNPVDSVTKDLSILVISNNSDGTSSKCLKAKKYGTEIMSENEFLSKYNK